MNHFALEEILPADATVSELLRPLLAPTDDFQSVTEICLNRPGELFVLAGATWHRLEVPVLTLEWALSLAQAVATFSEQDIGPQRPILSAMLPRGERVQIVVPPVVEPGRVSLTVRIPSATIKTLTEYEADGALSRYRWGKARAYAQREHELAPLDRELCEALEANHLREFLELAVREAKTIAVVGSTGSGKTSLLKSLCLLIPERERLVSIEDVRELLLRQPNAVHLLYSKGGQGVASVTPSDLIACMMRQFPNRGLLGELRGGEAFDYLKLLTTGHSGITSWHAESCALAIERFCFMAKEHPDAGGYMPAELRRLVTLTIDVIVHVVAKTIYDDLGVPVRLDRYVAEVRFDPVGKLVEAFGDTEVLARTATSRVTEQRCDAAQVL